MFRPLVVQSAIAAAVVLALGITHAAATSDRMTLAYGYAHRGHVTYDWSSALAARFPGCRASLPAGTLPTGFVVQRLDGSVERMRFDETWRRTHDRDRANDVWVVGQCR